MGCKKKKHMKYEDGGLAELLRKGKVRTEDMPEQMKKDVRKLYGEDVSADMIKKFKDEYEEDYKKPSFEKLKKKLKK